MIQNKYSQASRIRTLLASVATLTLPTAFVATACGNDDSTSSRAEGVAGAAPATGGRHSSTGGAAGGDTASTGGRPLAGGAATGGAGGRVEGGGSPGSGGTPGSAGVTTGEGGSDTAGAPPTGGPGGNVGTAGSAGHAGAAGAPPAGACDDVDCSHLDSDCSVGECNPADGSCSATAINEAQDCEDGSLCTTGDTCHAGACEGTPVDCSHLDTACRVGECTEVDGSCVWAPENDGLSCDDDPNDCVTETCQSGSCQAAAHENCSECSSGGTFCVSGSCVSESPRVFDFEENDVTFEWIGQGDAFWGRDNSQRHTGSGSLRSGTIEDDGISTALTEVVLSDPGEVSFFYMTDSASGDTLTFTIDGTTELEVDGAVDWTQFVAGLEAGRHVLSWTYAKDASGDAGMDAAWIDDITVAGDSLITFEHGMPQAVTWPATPWFLSTTNPYNGLVSLQSGDIGDAQTTTGNAILTFRGAGTVSLWGEADLEDRYDRAYFMILGDGAYWTADTDWAQQTFNVWDSGTHNLSFYYQKDNNTSQGQDMVRIDDIIISDSGACAPAP